jgi:hypothetical protein
MVKMEYGIANVLEQYQSNHKARALLGPMDTEKSGSFSTGSGGIISSISKSLSTVMSPSKPSRVSPHG